MVVTETSKHFVNVDLLKKTYNIPVWTDVDEWGHWKQKGDPVVHIDLMKWADMLLVAPLSANTLAKFAHGIADNLLTCIVRAWPLSRITVKPVLVAPAMNTCMWEHPLTGKQLKFICDEFGFCQIPPVKKLLACGDYGNGAMEEVPQIAEIVKNFEWQF